MKIFAVLVGAMLLSSCGSPTPETTNAASQPGFDPAEFDPDTRPQDDFFKYVNGIWVERTPIPAEYSSYGAMQIVAEKTELQLRDLVEAITMLKDRPSGSDDQKIADLYLGFMDEDRAEDLGIEPLADELARIAALKTHADVIAWFGHAVAASITVPVNFYIDTDASNPDQNLAYIWQDGLGLPDRDYWLEDTEKLTSVRAAYIAHIERMYELAGWPDGDHAATDIAALEKRIAESQWSRVQNRDREKIYTNKFTLDEAAKLSPGFNWASFLDAGGFGAPDVFVIAQTDFFSDLGEVIRTTPVETWQAYARFRTLKAFAPYLNNDLVLEDFDFEKRTLRGQEEIRPRWKRGIRLVNGGIGETIGKAYVERYFPPEAKQRVEAMIENLRKAFHESIDSLEWMSEETRKAAQKKLAAFNAKIGYPDVWRDYSELEIVVDDLVGNVRRAREFEHYRQVGKLSKPVDRTEWGMTPQTVNAYYRPTMNEIVFPAAILQPPFFDFDADDAINYGAIGAVIGHEFSHGFDDQGRKFDGTGRLSDWWTQTDADQYEARTVGLIEQYDAFEPLPDQSVNGELTLGENIADLAGVIVAYRAWELALEGSETPIIGGFSGPQRFFIGYGLTWRSKMRDEYLLNLLLSNPHSPPRYRVIGALQNVPEFYSAYGVKAGDGMYRSDDERVKIW